MSRNRRSAKARPRRRGSSRQALTVVAAGVLLALGAVASDEFVTMRLNAAAARAAAAKPDDNEIYTGSILYSADTGNVCRQLLFDNRDGRFADNGYVDCQRAAYHGMDAPKHWSADRVRVISSGFRGD